MLKDALESMEEDGIVYVLDPQAPRLYEQLRRPKRLADGGSFLPVEQGVYRLKFLPGGDRDAQIVPYADFVSDVSSARVAVPEQVEQEDEEARRRSIASIPEFKRSSLLKWQILVPPTDYTNDPTTYGSLPSVA